MNRHPSSTAFSQGYSEYDQNSVGRAWDLQELIAAVVNLDTLIRWRKVILAISLTVFTLGLTFIVVRPSAFIATASILVGGRNANPAAQKQFADGNTELQIQSHARDRLLAKRARLQSELQGAESVSFPRNLVAATAFEPEVQTWIDSETGLFEARRKARESELQNTQQLLKLTADEVQSLARQVELAASQQQSIDKELESVRQLASKGYYATSKLGDLDRTAATFATRKIELETQLLSRKQTVEELKQKSAQLVNDTKTDILNELQQVDADLKTAELRVANVSETLSFSGVADATVLANQIEMIQSDRTAEAVVQRLKLDEDAEFLSAPLSPFPLVSLILNINSVEPGTPEAKNLAASIVQSNLTASRFGLGSRLDIAYRADSPGRARSIANAVAALFTENPDKEASKTSLGGNEVLKDAGLIKAGPSALAILFGSAVFGIALGASAAFLLRFAELRAYARNWSQA
ncbi:hypothetical protein [Flaviflagellibacter deserti]|uniref:AprE-like long alpha-helical hairpin domain-containing protein n=1 Tax=Flaviflagellibacter deserti TaxID=2267266 RepID=A0ABV9Z7G9_9HYPH